MSSTILEYDFNKASLEKLAEETFGKNWPIIYILKNNKNDLYVGETTSAVRRINTHLDDEVRKIFSKVFIIQNDEFNKSATLDIESKLIEYIAADQKNILQNGNAGLRNHNYYEREKYTKIFKNIWTELSKKKVVNQSLLEIENSDLFKYSPYKALTDDQADIVEMLKKTILETTNSINIIHGEPGSGKTILAIYLVKFLLSQQETEKLKIGLVIPQTSLRETIRKIFRHVKGLKATMVLGPTDVAQAQDHYDVLIIDESHRLAQRRNLVGYAAFDNACKSLGLEPTTSSQLDWMLKQAKHAIFLYDEKQSVKPSDVDRQAFLALKEKNINQHTLTSQLRVLAGNKFVNYIDEIMRGVAKEKLSFDGYEFFLFDSLDQMVQRIRTLDQDIGLCRIVAGYAWDWVSKDNPDNYDIVIGECQLRWNSTVRDWINSDKASHEVGCIHTVQGYDLNYVGVIIGSEISYNNQKLIFHKENYKDRYGAHRSLSDAEILNFIINIYKTLMTRGIKGSYLYVCDEGLRNYLKNYINEFKSNEILTPSLPANSEESSDSLVRS